MADLEAEKQRAAIRAVDEICVDMCVGLGTGSTAAYAIKEIGKRVAEGLKVVGTATSERSEALARSLGIAVVAFSTLASVDLAIDGADEVDARLRAIKGGGGAHCREKIVASAAGRFIVIVDSSKPVDLLGKFKLPVEVLPFAALAAERALAQFSVPVSQRRLPDGSPFLTDQHAFVYDLSFGRIDAPEDVAQAIDAIPGVIEHGLFLREIDTLIVGRGDSVEISNRA